MDSEPEPSISKLAGEEELRGLLPAEPSDSGIDSDDDPRIPQRAMVSDSYSSDEELVLKAPWVPAVKKKDDEMLKVMAEENMHLPDVVIPLAHWHTSKDTISSDRSSPPLYEVELTASEEDDDGSVLELVIPIQCSKYQRVPTSSPKKGVPKPPRFFCSLFCCFRK